MLINEEKRPLIGPFFIVLNEKKPFKKLDDKVFEKGKLSEKGSPYDQQKIINRQNNNYKHYRF